MNDPERTFAEFLKSKGLKFTPERREILRVIFATHEHFDVETLFEVMKKRGERTSLATIYRLVPLLIESGMIRRATRLDGHVTYEHVFGHKPHHHLVCVKCGQIVEFRDEGIEQLLTEVCQKYDFSPIDQRLGVRGVCSSCREG
ncbi:MAG TPA: transcriptional repressor [Proteobacteria bacterium]|nr:transcriptional repressor [Pseudomonadota bacterium]